MSLVFLKIHPQHLNLKDISNVNICFNEFLLLIKMVVSDTNYKKIFPGTGEAEGETPADKAAEVSHQTPVAERRSQCVYQAAEGKHAEY